jgi:hypothetical protein
MSSAQDTVPKGGGGASFFKTTHEHSCSKIIKL